MSQAFAPDGRWVPAVGARVPAVGGDAVSARALAMPLSTVLGEVRPDSVTKLPDGDFLYHFPKNFVGTLRINTVSFLVLGYWGNTSRDAVRNKEIWKGRRTPYPRS